MCSSDLTGSTPPTVHRRFSSSNAFWQSSVHRNGSVPRSVLKNGKALSAELPSLTSPEQGAHLLLYIAASNSAVSAVLVQENKVQRPVYYVSEALQGAKIRYTELEKLAYALVMASRKLRLHTRTRPCALSMVFRRWEQAGPHEVSIRRQNPPGLGT